jgi:hypothetical protein
MKLMNRNRGVASVTILYVVTVLGFAAVSLTTLSWGGMKRSKREVTAAQAFQLAQAGVEYKYQALYTELANSHGDFQEQQISLASTNVPLPTGASGTIYVKPTADPTYAWVTCNATVGYNARSVRVFLRSKDVGIWNNAIFAGTGASGRAINGNIDIRGSTHFLGDGEEFTDLNNNGVRDAAEAYTDVNGNGQYNLGEPFVDANGDGVWNPAEPYNDSNHNNMYDPPLTVTDLNSSFSGNAFIGNNYDGMPSGLRNRVTAIPAPNGVQQLGTEVRVKHGRIGINGSAAIGSTTVSSTQKYTVDGTYVSDGWTGNQGSSHVYSDNGTTNGYDLGDMVSFPLITGIGAPSYTHPATGITYTNFKTYLDSVSLTVPLASFSTASAAFTYGPDARGNKLQWIPSPAPGRLVVEGIVRVNGNFTFGQKNQTIYTDGKGTIYSTGSIDVHANVLPTDGKIFPTGTVTGLVAVYDINLATGNGDSQLSMAGAYYAQGVIVSAKQNQIAGTFVSNYFDMGTNVPNIYQVPALSKNLPPGMPGDQAIVSMRKRTWRERAINPG